MAWPSMIVGRVRFRTYAGLNGRVERGGEFRMIPKCLPEKMSGCSTAHGDEEDLKKHGFGVLGWKPRMTFQSS